LQIDPRRDEYAGETTIDVTLEAPRRTVWLHGRDLHASRASYRRADGSRTPLRYVQTDPDGVVALVAPNDLPAGNGAIEIAWTAPFGTRLYGLHKVVTADGDGRAEHAYAFTQFEAVAAREAFPCFDEPAFKIPYDVTLAVPKGQRAIANARELASVVVGELEAHRFATTAPLPSYLLAFAVGPLDVVEAPAVAPNATRDKPLPLRGVAVAGKGPRLAYALAHTGEIVDALERYFGIAYPFDKLDVIAVPDQQGAMENAGAITFTEYLLLMDRERAPLSQKRAFATVMAHELAHQWFGDLVTMPWWDDIWLNEAFATWMASRIVEGWDPALHGELALLESIQGAMGTDALVAARAVRQPIGSLDDVSNAFDGITYQKGAGVISMFERWIGKSTFQAGISQYLRAHAGGNATASDLFAALAKASGKDVATPFSTFVDRPGVPLVDAELACDAKSAKGAIRLTQSRYFPGGSAGVQGQPWQIPICSKLDDRERCELLTVASETFGMPERCPSRVFANADAAGYYRVLLHPAQLEAWRKAGYAKLDERERLAFGDGVRASLSRGVIDWGQALAALEPFATDSLPMIANEPMGMLRTAREWLRDDGASSDGARKKLEARARALYARRYAALGWVGKGKGARDPRLEIDGPIDEAELREQTVRFLAFTAFDPAVRKAGAALGKRALGLAGKVDRSDIAPELLGVAISLFAKEEGDRAAFDALLARLPTEPDALERGRMLSALASMRGDGLAERARALVLDPRLRVSEMLSPLFTQLDDPELREDAWRWLRANVDAVVGRLSERSAGWLVGAGDRFCDARHRAEVVETFGPRAPKLDGGPRNLKATLERIDLCIARKEKQLPSVHATFR
jgi:alanyl aminopeptidase